MQKHKFPYNWRLSEAKFTKDKGKVFSCFACGGGSTMGYKLAGFDVIGCNEIDAKVNRCYVANHSPRYNFLEDIRTLRERERERERAFWESFCNAFMPFQGSSTGRRGFCPSSAGSASGARRGRRGCFHPS